MAGTQGVAAFGRQEWTGCQGYILVGGFSKQKASVSLIQQPRHTDVCRFTRDHLEIMSKRLGEDRAFSGMEQAGVPGPPSGETVGETLYLKA